MLKFVFVMILTFVAGDFTHASCPLLDGLPPCQGAPGGCTINADNTQGGFVAHTAKLEKDKENRNQCYLGKSASVCEYAEVSEDARVLDHAEISGHAKILGHSWISGNARVSGNAEVDGGPQVYGDAQISGDARVLDRAQVFNQAQITGHARISMYAQVFGQAQVSDRAHVTSNSQVSGNAHVSGQSQIAGYAQVSDNSQVSDSAIVTGNAQVSGHARVSGKAKVFGNAGVAGYARVEESALVSQNAQISDFSVVSGHAQIRGDARVVASATNEARLFSGLLTTGVYEGLENQDLIDPEYQLEPEYVIFQGPVFRSYQASEAQELREAWKSRQEIDPLRMSCKQASIDTNSETPFHPNHSYLIHQAQLTGGPMCEAFDPSLKEAAESTRNLLSLSIEAMRGDYQNQIQNDFKKLVISPRILKSKEQLYVNYLRVSISRIIQRLNDELGSAVAGHYDRKYFSNSLGYRGQGWLNLSASGRDESQFNELLKQIEENNEPKFVEQLIRLATTFDLGHEKNKANFIKVMTQLFVTKQFPTERAKHFYLALILGCGEIR